MSKDLALPSSNAFNQTGMGLVGGGTGPSLEGPSARFQADLQRNVPGYNPLPSTYGSVLLKILLNALLLLRPFATAPIVTLLSNNATRRLLKHTFEIDLIQLLYVLHSKQ